MFAAEIGAQPARQEWATCPAHTHQERIRLYAVARMTGERLGSLVAAVPEDAITMRFTVVGTGDALG